MRDKKAETTRLLNATCTRHSETLKDVCKTIKCEVALLIPIYPPKAFELKKEVLADRVWNIQYARPFSLDASFMSSK